MQAKADAARHAAEQQAAENAQLAAHLSLLEGERDAAQARLARHACALRGSAVLL